jgi:hypothetical protein
MYSQGVQQTEAFIRSHFHPLGRLIIYGYSAGGLDALDLVRRISMWTYDFSTQRLLSCCSILPDVGIVRVDLLVTVDVADGPISGILDRYISPSARRNINFYQTYPASRPGAVEQPRPVFARMAAPPMRRTQLQPSWRTMT